jgi:chromosome segregation ATPase
MPPDSHNMKIVPERDDDDLMPVGRMPVGNVPEGRSSEGGKPPRVASKRAGTSGSLGLLWVAIVLLLAGLAAVFYQNTQLIGKLAEQQSNLNKAGERIQLLESELTATGLDLSQSGSTLEKRIEISELDIRKLWDLSNKRNRPDIAQNATTLKTLSQKLSALEADLKGQQVALKDEIVARDNQDKALKTEQATYSQRFTVLNTDLGSLKTSLNELKTGFSGQKTELNALQTKLSAANLSMNANIGELDRNQAQLKTQIEAFGRQLAKKDEGLEYQNIEQTLQDYDERLDAIDASRRQLTSHVTRLNTEVNNLQLEVNTLTKK